MADTALSQLSRKALLEEMLGSVASSIPNQWSVLLMDDATTHILSRICGISDVLDYGVSLVDDVRKRREPLAQLHGIYFITPSDESVQALIRDFSLAAMPQYKSAFVFFSSPPSPQQLQAIKSSPHLMSRIKTLQEVNVEYILVDKRTFSTYEGGALRAFFGAGVDSSSGYRDEIERTATRLATVFATLKEFPAIRFRAAAPPGEEFPPGLESRLLVAQRIAVETHDRLMQLQRQGALPDYETCELVITDRGFDPVAPVIHEWTYEAMIHDLFAGTDSLHDNVFSYEAQTQGGKTERKEHVLDERDALFVDLRHQHFAGASLKISSLLEEFQTKNKVTKSKSVGEMDLRNMSKLIQSLPQYRDQLSKLSAHVEIASKLNHGIELNHLTELGKLEQDLVYGDATSKEVISFLSQGQALPAADKVRLLMCYSATHVEKLDATRQQQWQKVARLTPADMDAITNLEYLGVPVRKRNKGVMSFGRKRKRAIRKDREADEDDQQFALSRFVPMLQELVEDVVAGKLSQDEYPYVQTPSSPGPGSASVPGSRDGTPTSAVASARTMRTTTGAWARKAGGTPDKEAGSSKGRRVFVFVLGGITHSEMRTTHRLSAKMGRDIYLGGTSVETPSTFLGHMSELGHVDQVALEIESPGGRFRF